MKKNSFIFFLIITCFLSAQGPQNVAVTNRNLWPFSIESSKDFDIASKMEMLVFIEVFSDINKVNNPVLISEINVKNPNIKGVDKWKLQTEKRLISNFKHISKEALLEIVQVNDVSTFDKVKQQAISLQTKLPAKLKEWYKQSKLFYKAYILECIRLAAKNPTRTSEIDLLDSSEINGFDLNDKSFLLTFDDGPSAVGGNTDKVLTMLKNENLTAVFFLSGHSLKNRITKDKNIKSLYTGNSIGSHSMIHESHQYLKTWKTQVDDNYQLIKNNFNINNQTIFFRPPYGQRTLEMSKYLALNNQVIMLWNVDSMDWSSKLNSQEVASRVIALMLLWRKGIILFHDIHSKALNAVPEIKEYFDKSNLVWINARNL